MAWELEKFGIDLKAYTKAGGELVLSEYGLGGGREGDYSTPARNAIEVANMPYCEWSAENEERDTESSPELMCGCVRVWMAVEGTDTGPLSSCAGGSCSGGHRHREPRGGGGGK